MVRAMAAFAAVLVGASAASAQRPVEAPSASLAAPEAAEVDARDSSMELAVHDTAPDEPDDAIDPRYAREPVHGSFTPWPFGVVLGALGVTGVLTGLVMGGTALAQSDRARNPSGGFPGCVGSHCTESAYAGVASAHSLSIAADVVLFSGVGLAVAGVVLALALGDDGSPPLSAACDGNGCQAVVQGVF